MFVRDFIVVNVRKGLVIILKLLIILLIIVVIAIIVFLLKDKNGEKGDVAIASNDNPEYYRMLNSINSMSYKQLEKIHDELLPLCNEISFVLLPYTYGEKAGSKSQKDTIKLIAEKRNELLPEDKRIYGCNTYGEAEDLNREIVKRIDYLYDNGSI